MFKSIQQNRSKEILYSTTDFLKVFLMNPSYFTVNISVFINKINLKSFSQ